MNWLNIELTTLRSEQYLGSDPIHRATWLNLLSYCADQENGGTIKDCMDWGSRRWLQLLGVTKEEVLMPSDLWKWSGSNLIVWNYPKSKEAEVRRKRESGKKGGRPPKTKDEKPDGSPDVKPDGSDLLKRKGIGKEEERNSKKKLSDELNDFLLRFNEASGKCCRVIDEKTEKQFKARIKEGFTVDDMINAVKNIKADNYHREQNFKHLSLGFVTRADKLQAWANAGIITDKDGNASDFVPFHQNGKSWDGIPLCDGLTREQFIEKFGRVS